MSQMETSAAALVSFESFEQVTLIAEELPDHMTAIETYVKNGLTATAARTLETIAARIISMDRVAMLAVGEQLAKANSLAKHGTWGPFLERVGHTEAGARNLMNVYKAFINDPEFVMQMKATSLYLLAAPQADKQVVKEIVREVKAGAPAPSLAEVKQRLQAPRDAEVIDLDAEPEAEQIQMIDISGGDDGPIEVIDVPVAPYRPTSKGGSAGKYVPPVKPAPAAPAKPAPVLENLVAAQNGQLPRATEATYLNNPVAPNALENAVAGHVPSTEEEEAIFGAPTITVPHGMQMSEEDIILYRHEVMVRMIEMHEAEIATVTKDLKTIIDPGDLERIAKQALSNLRVSVDALYRYTQHAQHGTR